MQEPVVNERERRHAEYLKTHGIPFPEAWYNHNAFLSLFFAAASVAIPDAERLVVQTVQEVIARKKFPELDAEITNIIHEESAHARVHDAFNDYLKTLGLPVEQHARAIRRVLAFVHRSFSLQTRLAMCAGVEHLTASGARQILDNGVFEGKGVDERMDRVWTWHSLEELDHRSAVFDLYLATGGGYGRRVWAMLWGTLLFLYAQNSCFLSFLKHENLLWSYKGWKSALPLLFGKRGIYRSITRDWLQFFKPGFHPSQIPIQNSIQKQLHHYHIESELISYFAPRNA